MIAQELADAINQRREKHLKSLAKVFRQTCPRASGLSSCAREMYYQITAWDKRPVPEPYLQARFLEGHTQEAKVIRELNELGFEIVEGQMPFELKDRKDRIILTGHIDGKCLWKDKKVPFEVKSLDPHIYDTINEVNDFNRYEWAKRYPLQMASYLFGYNEENGIFILTDCKGHRKIFTITLNYELMEKILQRCELVMDCVEQKIPPKFHTDLSVCRKCWALGRICTPPMDFSSGELKIINDDEIEAKLILRDKLKSNLADYMSIDKQIKNYFLNRPHCLCGDWEITGKEITKKIVAQEAKEISYWQTKIEKILDKSSKKE